MAADGMLVVAYHFPFPTYGHTVKNGTSYELEPVMWTPLWQPK